MFGDGGVHRSAQERQTRERAMQHGDGCVVGSALVGGTDAANLGGLLGDQLGSQLAGEQRIGHPQ